MTDIFISYARERAAEAIRVAEALRGLGHGVWRDDEIPAHRSFEEMIEERLAAAKVVLVLWSVQAAKSEWVRSEASRARGDGQPGAADP
jgi:adenylate cyclase